MKNFEKRLRSEKVENLTEKSDKQLKKETIQKLKEAVKILGTTSSARIIKNCPQYLKYFDRFYRHKVEWGYEGWEDFLAKEGLRKSLKDEAIEKLTEAVEKFGLNSSKIEKTEYSKYLRRVFRKGLKWQDLLKKEIIPRQIKKEIFEKYKFHETIASLDMEKIVKKFLEEKYPQRKEEFKKPSLQVLRNWQEEIREKLRKEKGWPY